MCRNLSAKRGSGTDRLLVRPAALALPPMALELPLERLMSPPEAVEPLTVFGLLPRSDPAATTPVDTNVKKNPTANKAVRSFPNPALVIPSLILIPFMCALFYGRFILWAFKQEVALRLLTINLQ